jgi:tetratricopeptide (TPR) repeat protein
MNEKAYNFQINEDDDIFALLSKMEDFPEFTDVRFVHKDNIILIDEKFKYLSEYSSTIHVYINSEMYVYDDNNACFREGNSSYNKDDFRRAISKYTTAIERHPTKLKSYGNRGLCYQKLNNQKEAIEDFNHYISNSVGEDEFIYKVYFRRSRSYFRYANLLKVASSSEEDEEKPDPSIFFSLAVKDTLKYLESAPDEKSSQLLTEMDYALNYLLLTKNPLPCCFLCRRSTNVVSVEIVPKFIHKEEKEEYKFLCQSCVDICHVKEKAFEEKVYSKMVENPDVPLVISDPTSFYDFIIGMNLRNLMFWDFGEVPYERVVYRVNEMRYYLLEKDTCNRDCFGFYSESVPSGIKFLLKRDYMHNCDYMYCQLNNFHLITVIQGSSYEWNLEDRVDTIGDFKLEKKELPQNLMEFIRSSETTDTTPTPQ